MDRLPSVPTSPLASTDAMRSYLSWCEDDPRDRPYTPSIVNSALQSNRLLIVNS